MFTAPAPAGPVNPAEEPVAQAVLDSALLHLHDTKNFNHIYHLLSGQYGPLSEELHKLMLQEAQRRAAENCTTKVIQFIPTH